jgi:hypothetical protein
MENRPWCFIQDEHSNSNHDDLIWHIYPDCCNNLVKKFIYQYINRDTCRKCKHRALQEILDEKVQERVKETVKESVNDAVNIMFNICNPPIETNNVTNHFHKNYNNIPRSLLHPNHSRSGSNPINIGNTLIDRLHKLKININMNETNYIDSSNEGSPADGIIGTVFGPQQQSQSQSQSQQQQQTDKRRDAGHAVGHASSQNTDTSTPQFPFHSVWIMAFEYNEQRDAITSIGVKCIDNQAEQEYTNGSLSKMWKDLLTYMKEDVIQPPPSPQLIVMHNGHKCNEILLQKQLQKVNCSIPSSWWFIDTLNIIKRCIPEISMNRCININDMMQNITRRIYINDGIRNSIVLSHLQEIYNLLFISVRARQYNELRQLTGLEQACKNINQEFQDDTLGQYSLDVPKQIADILNESPGEIRSRQDLFQYITHLIQKQERRDMTPVSPRMISNIVSQVSPRLMSGAMERYRRRHSIKNTNNSNNPNNTNSSPASSRSNSRPGSAFSSPKMPIKRLDKEFSGSPQQQSVLFIPDNCFD